MLGFRPGASSDLRHPAKAAGESRLNRVGAIGFQPGELRGLICDCRGSRLSVGRDLVPSALKIGHAEPSDALRERLDRRREIEARAERIVGQSTFDDILRQVEEILDTGEQLFGKSRSRLTTLGRNWSICPLISSRS